MDLLIIKLLPDTDEKNLHLLHTPAQRPREKPHPDALQPPLQRLHLEHTRLLESAILGPAPDRQLEHLVVDVRFGEAGSDELLLHDAHVLDVETGFHRAFGQVLEEFHDEGGAGDGVVVGDGGGFEIDDFDVAAGFEGTLSGSQLPGGGGLLSFPWFDCGCGKEVVVVGGGKAETHS